MMRYLSSFAALLALGSLGLAQDYRNPRSSRYVQPPPTPDEMDGRVDREPARPVVAERPHLAVLTRFDPAGGGGGPPIAVRFFDPDVDPFNAIGRMGDDLLTSMLGQADKSNDQSIDQVRKEQQELKQAMQ